MAKANSSSTLHAVEDAPSFNPSTINPLIVDESPADTMLAVSEVLAFLSGAMENSEGGSDRIPLDGGCTGLARILDTCRSALDFHRHNEGCAS